ncbi:hypothetical protein ACOME3_005250 [Neoechinorhynchus agilis]
MDRLAKSIAKYYSKVNGSSPRMDNLKLVSSDGKEILVNAELMAVHSHLFSLELQYLISARLKQNDSSIKFPLVCSEILTTIAKRIRNTKYCLKISEENALSLLLFVNRYRFDNLVHEAIGQFRNSLNTQNIIKNYLEANRHQNANVLDTVNEYVGKNFHMIVEDSEDLYRLNDENFLAIIGNDQVVSLRSSIS